MALDEIKERIISLCQQHWDIYGKVYLLSRLGLDLGEDRLEIERSAGKKLRDFISSEMSNELRIERWPDSPNIWGIFPRDALLVEDLAFYFPKRNAVVSDSVGKAPRYNSRFWAAFSIPITPGCRRYLDLRGSIRFHDVAAGDPSPPGMLEIEAERIPPPDAQQREVCILSQIDDWTAKNGLDKLEFTAEMVSSRSAKNGEGGAQRSASTYSVLHLLVETLDSVELGKLSLPLDVVAKLLRKPARH